MYTIKEISTWYDVHYNTMRRKLVQLNIIHSKGRGRTERLSLSQLQPLFAKNGCPKNLTLTLPLFN